MNTQEARDTVTRLIHRIAPEVDVDTADPDALLQDTFDLDSMDFLNLMSALHTETGIDVPERDYPELATVAGFVSYVAAASPDIA